MQPTNRVDNDARVQKKQKKQKRFICDLIVYSPYGRACGFILNKAVLRHIQRTSYDSDSARHNDRHQTVCAPFRRQASVKSFSSSHQIRSLQLVQNSVVKVIKRYDIHAKQPVINIHQKHPTTEPSATVACVYCASFNSALRCHLTYTSGCSLKEARRETPPAQARHPGRLPGFRAHDRPP